MSVSREGRNGSGQPTTPNRRLRCQPQQLIFPEAGVRVLVQGSREGTHSTHFLQAIAHMDLDVGLILLLCFYISRYSISWGPCIQRAESDTMTSHHPLALWEVMNFLDACGWWKNTLMYTWSCLRIWAHTFQSTSIHILSPPSSQAHMCI